MRLYLLTTGLLAMVLPGLAAVHFDCDRGVPLQEAIRFAFPGETLELSGRCIGPVVIIGRNLTLSSKSHAVIDGDSQGCRHGARPGSSKAVGTHDRAWAERRDGLGRAQLIISATNVQKNTQNGILAVLTSIGNKQDGVHLEESSVLTMFNMPAFSSAPGVTTLNAQNNMMNGVSVLTDSNLTVIHFAEVNSLANVGAGISVDNGSGLTLVGSTVQGNREDIVLSFGSRGDITGTTLGTLTCDATVLLRGDTKKVCK